MADKRIQDLTPASQVQTSDRFVLEQSGQAKSLTGQILINDLAAFLDGHGGINDISYTPPSGSSLTGTLTITLADETVETFSVTNGRGITSFTKTGTSGLEDTYTITYNDGSTPTTFTVTNGRSIESIGYVESVGLDDYYQIDYNDGDPTTFIVHNGEKGDTGDNWYVHIKWAAVMPTQDSDMVNIPSDFIGIYAGISATAPTDYTEYAWYDYKGEKGDTGTSISSVAWQSSSGLVDTYRVNFDDGTSTTFNVTNGSQIDSITKTSTVGLVDTYTVRLTNGNQTTFQVNNGKSIVSITWTSTTSPTGVPHVPGATDTYTVSYNDGDSTTFQVYNGLDGEGASITVDGIPSVNGNVPLLVIDTEHGAPTPQTQGSTKSRYFDAINSVLYICLGYDENNGYIWRGAGVTVDSALSTSSTNPVQNRIITNKIGTAALDTTAQDLSGAVNEILDDISGFADNLADEYDATATYAVGDLCIYNNTLYRCNTAISTPEAWNSIHWTATSVADVIIELLSDIEETESKIPTDAVADLNTLPTLKQQFVKFNSTTLNTPYTEGKTTNTMGMVLSLLSGNNGTQLAFCVGDSEWFIRTRQNQTWGAWTRYSFNDYVLKSGDTMTGELTVARSGNVEYLKVKNTALAVSDTPSSNTYNSIVFTDKNDVALGVVRLGYMASGNHELQFRASNGSVNNDLHIRVKGDGTPDIGMTQATAWRNTLGLGTSGTLPITIAQGGTGQTAVERVTTATDIFTPASGVTLLSGSYSQWGKVAVIVLGLKSSSAITTAGVNVGTLKTGKRPISEATIIVSSPVVTSAVAVKTDGSVTVRAAINANTNFYIGGTYLLA